MEGTTQTGFEVKIEQGENLIKLDENSVNSVEFLIDTVEENVKDRSENVINKVTIKGNITPESSAETRKVLLWSMDKQRDLVYRKATISLKTGGMLLREYEMDMVFCIDYIETFKNDGECTYTLIIGQRKDNLSGIKAYS